MPRMYAITLVTKVCNYVCAARGVEDPYVVVYRSWNIVGGGLTRFRKYFQQQKEMEEVGRSWAHLSAHSLEG